MLWVGSLATHLIQINEWNQRGLNNGAHALLTNSNKVQEMQPVMPKTETRKRLFLGISLHGDRLSFTPLHSEISYQLLGRYGHFLIVRH